MRSTPFVGTSSSSWPWTSTARSRRATGSPSPSTDSGCTRRATSSTTTSACKPPASRLAYYPRDVWLYLLLAGWWRVHPEMNLVGRAGAVGDELGSALIGSRLVSDLMRLCFLMERQYAPYSKWFGTAFARLPCGPDLTPILWRVVQAETWQRREDALLAAYEKLAAMHNALQLTEPVSTDVEQMWDRPFRVAWADFPGAPARPDPGSGGREHRGAVAGRSGRPVPGPALAGQQPPRAAAPLRPGRLTRASRRLQGAGP